MSTETPRYFRLPNGLVCDDDQASWLAVLPGAAIKVLLVLVRHADSSGVCWPAWPRLMELTGLSRNGLRSAITRLEQCGLVTCDRSIGRPTHYHVATSALSAPPPVRFLDNTGALSAPPPVRFLDRTSALFGQKQCAQRTRRKTKEGRLKKECASRCADEIAQPHDAQSTSTPSTTIATGTDDADFALTPSTAVHSASHRKAGPSATQMDAWFADFWAAYPRRVDKGRARRCYPAALKSATTEWACGPTDAAERITAAAAKYASSRRGDDQKYTKHPATWLNALSFLDESTVPAAALVKPQVLRAVWEGDE